MRSGDKYMNQRARTAMVQSITCGLSGINILLEPVVNYWLTGPIRKNFEMWIKPRWCLINGLHLKIPSAKWRLSLPGFNILKRINNFILTNRRGIYIRIASNVIITLIARFMGSTWDPPGADRTQVGQCWPHELCYVYKLSINDSFPQTKLQRYFVTTTIHQIHKSHKKNLSHIPQCIIQNRNVHISVLNDVLWDMRQVHCRIC